MHHSMQPVATVRCQATLLTQATEDIALGICQRLALLLCDVCCQLILHHSTSSSMLIPRQDCSVEHCMLVCPCLLPPLDEVLQLWLRA